MKKEKITQVTANDATGREQKVSAKDIYAVVYQGRPYIATDYSYYPLEKRGNDFFFTGKAKATTNARDVMAAQMMFGLLGGLLAANTTALYEMRIDHLSGGFVQIKEVKPAVMRMK